MMVSQGREFDKIMSNYGVSNYRLSKYGMLNKSCELLFLFVSIVFFLFYFRFIFQPGIRCDV